MTLQTKILLLNVVLFASVITGVAFATDSFPGNGFFYMLGVIGMAGGLGCLAVGALLMIRRDKRPAKGYLTSSALLILIGLASFFLLNKY